MQDILNNREDLQNYLLATDDLNNSIQESLHLVVGNGRLNDRTAVRHESDLNPTTNILKQNNNSLDVVYKKHGKFDFQNRIIGSK